MNQLSEIEKAIEMTSHEDWIKIQLFEQLRIRRQNAIVINLDDGKNNKAMKENIKDVLNLVKVLRLPSLCLHIHMKVILKAP